MTWAALLLLLAAAPSRAATFTITIATSGPVTPLAIVTSTPSGIVCPSTCTFAFAADSTVTVGEVHPSTMAFAGWTAPCRSNLPSCTIRLSGNTSVTAKFDPLLDVSFSGTGIGSVAIPGQSTFTNTSDGARSLVYPAGTTVVLTRSTGTASAFVGWTSSAGGCSTASTCTVTLNAYTTVVATFTAAGTVGVSSFTIRVVLPNPGGIVYSSPAGITCGSTNAPCAFAFVSGQTVALTTQALAGYRFGGWANGGCARNMPCVVQSTSPLQGLGGRHSPAAYFYPVTP